MQSVISEILVSSDQIAERIRTLAVELTRDLDTVDDDGEFVLVPVLTGSMIFTADLVRHLSVKLRLYPITVSSYPGTATTSQGAMIESTLPDSFAGRHVLIVDDILDSGRTITSLRHEIAARSPRSVRACVLLRKDTAVARETLCEYIGFDIPDEFVVGYGLDYNGYYRNLPDIGVLHPAVIDAGAEP